MCIRTPPHPLVQNIALIHQIPAYSSTSSAPSNFTMFFTKYLVPALAVFGMAASVIATPVVHPISGELVSKRADNVLSTVQGVSNSLTPLTKALASATATADVVAKVDAIVDVFAKAKVDLLGLVGVDITADVDVIAKLNVDLIVKLLAALNLHAILNLSIVAKIDAALSAYLSVLATINANVTVKIGKGIPLLSLNIFVFLKLILTAKVLGLVNVLGLLGL
ncbi:hypothetical protein BXZ70DRAFT_802515 [Cristinia sonorae]|uniref:Transmembrane protein n=1 Tax=Cristinia sonorae TaxID=1940300 RepID=A0A8K0XS93_9AGAR|nr:hypothetical protein BXZ70DRAFT_802515 [Cristinia sonorae]